MVFTINVRKMVDADYGVYSFKRGDAKTTKRDVSILRFAVFLITIYISFFRKSSAIYKHFWHLSCRLLDLDRVYSTYTNMLCHMGKYKKEVLAKTNICNDILFACWFYAGGIYFINEINMDWQKNDNFLEKNFSFGTFVQAIDFINKIAEAAEKLNHHPEIFLHNYNQVRIQITTHSKKGLTEKDYKLAELIDLI